MSPALWSRFLVFALTLSVFPCTAVAIARNETKDSKADSDSLVKTYFTNPSSDSTSHGMPTYELGSIQNITWTTNLNVYNISIWQRATGNVTSMDSGGDGVSIQGGNVFERVTSFSWVVQTYSFDLSLSSIFYFSIDGDATSTSRDFDITTTAPASSSSTSLSQSPSSNTDAQPATEPTSLTSTGKIALGLGVGVGAPLITLLAILAYFQYRSGRRAYSHAESQSPSHLFSHPPSGLGVGSGGMGYASPSAVAMSMGQQQRHQQHLAVPPLIPALYPNFSVDPVACQSELQPKFARPVQLHPWEIDAHPRIYSPVTVPAEARAPVSASLPEPPPRPPSVGLGVGRSGSAGRGSGSGSGSGSGRSRSRSRSRPSTNSTRSRSVSTTVSTSTSSSSPRARSRSKHRGIAGGPSRGHGPDTGIEAREIPELPGESYNFF
ncbi:uncharacterized protein DSM5745_10239 [Aspergillus mulundensis]|uniref:Mid2 domain-containing protein n=1 Tax=Aspergillus mulundensis TaxID=1810919 RepID=A0A3D8QN72_9EURO|nr:hypothetical protein DSM5745_10239 [Aspergillus mulundensis]RDW63128.1 hypothetical protein DSM5745_10239 [Aspergillus mulundensis]